MDEPHSTDGRRATLYALAMFAVGALVLLLVFWNLPPLDADERQRIHVPPRSIQHVQDMAAVGSKYVGEYYYSTMMAVATLYIFLQVWGRGGGDSCVLISR